MCGIFALFRRGPAEPFAVHESLSQIEHRGPDDCGWLAWEKGAAPQCGRADAELTGSVILGHQRLTIIDLSPSGWQPMTLGTGRYAMTFNGEIYNYRELREELIQAGRQFESRSDSEVLLVAWAHWGSACFSRLTGMFSCVILDMQENEIIIARDAFGIKPLFWCHTPEGLAVSSEIWPLIDLAAHKPRINQQRSYDYLRFGQTDEDRDTMLEGIYNFPAANWARVRLENITEPEPQKYWNPGQIAKQDVSLEEATRQVRDVFMHNVELHMRSDVEVAAALSGGIDSSAIVCAMRRLAPKAPIKCFSFVSEDKALSEERWVDTVAEIVSADVHKVAVSPIRAVDDLSRLVRTQGEPFRSSSILAQNNVFRAANEAGIKVLLNGQGADEIFAGYNGYRGDKLAALIASGRIPAAMQFLMSMRKTSTASVMMTMKYAMRRSPSRRFKSFLRALSRQPECPAWIDRARLDGSVKLFAAHDFGGSSNALTQGLISTLTRTSLPALLRYDDRNSMSYGVESRVPFLTTGLVDLAYSLPDDYLLTQSGMTKFVFRQALRGLVPDAILDRKDKIGFIAPSAPLFASLVPHALSLIEMAPDFLDRDRLRTLLEQARNGRVADEAAIWRIICYLQWICEIRKAGIR